jgi:hypothetical protein
VSIDYKEYHPKWTLIRRLILKRAKNCCEWCHITNHAIVSKKDRISAPSAAHWDMMHSKRKSGFSWQSIYKKFGYTKIVLTIAHIDHDHNNNSFHNLAALCQKCHLGHDAKQHQSNRKYGRYHNRKHQHQLRLI